MPGTLFVVATPIGNLEDVTARALRILRDVKVIAAEDTRRTAHLLAHYAITTPTTSLHEHNEYRKARALLARLSRGDDVALVSDAGTPTISDPGQLLIKGAIAEGIRLETVPGPSAAIAALVVSGFPTETFSFLGFPPTRSKDRERWFDQAKRTGGTVIFFEAPHRIRETLVRCQQVFGDRPVVISRELTKKHEQLVRGPISGALEQLATVKGEITVVLDVGHMTEHNPSHDLSERDAVLELGVLTNNTALTRRQAINLIAKRYNLPANRVYQMIEDGKK